MCQHCMNRREFGALAAAGVVGSMAGLSSAVAADPLTVEAWGPGSTAGTSTRMTDTGRSSA